MRIAAMILTLTASIGASAQTTSRTNYEAPNSASNPRGTWIFGGLSGGALDNIRNESAVNIDQTGLKVIGSMYSENWVNDISLGAFRFENKDANSHTDTAVLEGVAGYRLSDTWHAGPILNTTLGHARDLGSSDDTMAAFGGVGIFKDWAVSNSTLVRLGLKGMADLNIPSQTVTNAALELQVGGTTSPTRVNDQARAPKREALPAPRVPAAAAEGVPMIQQDVAEIELSQKVYFDLDQATLSPKAQAEIQRISKALKDNPEVAGGIEVRGFADPTGTAAHNDRLSQKRADSVKSLMAKDGVSKVKVRSRGLGEREPVLRNGVIDNSESRRVEFVLKDVKDQQKAKKLLSSIE